MTVERQWTTQPVGDLRAKTKYALTGEPFGSNLVSRDYTDDGVPVIRGCNLPDNAPFAFDDLVFVSEKKADALRPNNAFPGDLIFTQRGTLGQVGLIPKDSPYSRFVISQSQMKLAVDPEKADARYLYYYFRLPSTVEAIHSLAISSGVPHINLDILRKFQIITPPVPIQQKITAILSAYDELIENNKRRIALLEKMAEEIYREWFVRFRFPGDEKVKFVKGAPADWKAILIGDLLNRISPGKLYEQKTAAVSGKVPILDQGQSGIIGYHDNDPGVVASPEKPVIVFANHTCYQRLIFSPFSAIQNVLPFVPSATNKSNIFWLHFATNGVIELSEYKGHWPAFVTKRIYYPGFELTELFGNVVAPMLKLKFQLEKTKDALQKSRDLLLPRLISGKLSVENLDIQFPPGMAGEAEAVA